MEDKEMDTSSQELREEDTMKILLATDCHLGYEHSTKRLQENDSFITFEEILKLALKHDVDFILLGGDLFHDSKPSQKVVLQCMELLKKYTLGERDIKIQFLSDPEIIFPHASQKVVNYEDPNLNVAMPIFSIHGNHDNPSFESTGTMDILGASGFINYFGKWADLNDVTIPPLVFNKGKTFVSVYGLSFMNDQRLSRLLRDDKINFPQPSGISEPFKMFVLHQNRAKHTTNGYIPEDKLPAFLDLIFWGHEHQCRVVPEQIVDNSADPPRRYYITQPGSPVATSLCEGEAVEKHVGLLKVNKTRFNMKPIKLKTVRPFVFESIRLKDVDIQADYTKPLADFVYQYIDEYIQNVIIPKTALQLTGHPQQPTLPLVRLRIFYDEDAQLFDPARISRKYHDTVANPRDMIIFRKESTKKSSARDDEENEDFADMNECFQHEGDIDWNVSVQGSIQKYFSRDDKKDQLTVLSVDGLNEALSRYVEAADDDAFQDVINHQIKKNLQYMEKFDIDEEKEIIQQLKEYRQERQAAEADGAERRDVQNILDDATRKSPKKKTQSIATEVENDEQGTSSDEMDYDQFRELERSNSRRAAELRARQPPGRSGSKPKPLRNQIAPLPLSKQPNLFHVSKKSKRGNGAAAGSSGRGRTAASNKPVQSYDVSDSESE
ncbi:double-strand break repair protein MRE11 [Venturia canescens]|uniref:double-strand break repair protein MRE11 n=1 Tax=Venturia canescens TaxID=32260 RepID=UPI001C9D59E9|nr:double-strand break repair protein MRE11 [Venturia canescens]